MESQRKRVKKKHPNPVMNRVLVAVKIDESSAISERDTASSSPLLDDFDEQLCFDLEEVGKELDRYKEETSLSPRQEKVLPLDMVRKENSPASTTTSSWLSTPSPPLSPFPVFMPEDTIKHWAPGAHLSTSLGATKVQGTEATADPAKDQSTAAPLEPTSPSLTAKSEDEYECQVKALISLRHSLVVKVKMLITHKRNLSLQKDLLLENFDGDKSKLIENLLENVSQSKQINAHIQGLNEQISVTNKKIVELKKYILTRMKGSDTEKEQHDGAVIYEQNLAQTLSEAKRTLLEGNKRCESSNINQPNNEGKQQLGKISPQEGKSAAQNKKSYVRSNSTPVGLESSLPKPQKPTENRENSACEVMEKLSGQLAIHPTSKNTLWCNTCNLFFVSIKNYLKHLEASEHLNKVEAMGEKSLYKMFCHSSYIPEKEDSGSLQEEAFGVEFLRSAKVVFCSLCECVLLTREEATVHVQSLQHTIKYKEYLLHNTSKELSFLKAKMGAFTEYCKRRKATGVDKKKKEGKNKDQYQKDTPRIDDIPSSDKADPSKNKQVKLEAGGENNLSCQLKKLKEGIHVIRDDPLMPNDSVSTPSAQSIARGGKKRTAVLPAMNKRQKVDSDSQL